MNSSIDVYKGFVRYFERMSELYVEYVKSMERTNELYAESIKNVEKINELYRELIRTNERMSELYKDTQRINVDWLTLFWKPWITTRQQEKHQEREKNDDKVKTEKQKRFLTHIMRYHDSRDITIDVCLLYILINHVY